MDPTAPNPSDANSDASIWYFAKPDGQREGPFPITVLKGRMAAGQLQPTDLIWKQGFSAWTPAREVPDLYGPSPGAAPAPTIPASLSRANPGSLMSSFFAGTASPGFLRITGRIFGALAVLTFLASIPLWFFNWSYFTDAFIFAFLFVAGEVSSSIIESQHRIETLLQSRPDSGK